MDTTKIFSNVEKMRAEIEQFLRNYKTEEPENVKICDGIYLVSDCFSSKLMYLSVQGRSKFFQYKVSLDDEEAVRKVYKKLKEKNFL